MAKNFLAVSGLRHYRAVLCEAIPFRPCPHAYRNIGATTRIVDKTV
jgi:hypothetical protein